MPNNNRRLDTTLAFYQKKLEPRLLRGYSRPPRYNSIQLINDALALPSGPHETPTKLAIYCPWACLCVSLLIDISRRCLIAPIDLLPLAQSLPVRPSNADSDGADSVLSSKTSMVTLCHKMGLRSVKWTTSDEIVYYSLLSPLDLRVLVECPIYAPKLLW